MVSAKPTVKVALRGPDGEVETLWAFDLGGDHYRLDNTPWYAYGISWHDVVEALPNDSGQLQFVKVVSKSGNRTVRIASQVSFTDELLESIVSLGATYEGSNRRYIGINIPPSLDLRVVTAFFSERAIRWEYADPTHEEVHGSESAV